MMKTIFLSLTLLFSFFYCSSNDFNVLRTAAEHSCSHSKASHINCSHEQTATMLTASTAETLIAQLGKYIKSASKAKDSRIKTIVIDAGHGGRDHGCSGKGSKEKDIALNVALLLGQSVEYNFPNIKVIYTRKKDVFIPLHKRADIANRNHADLFISIHCNSIPNASYVKGSETYVLGLHRAEDNLEVAKRENASILLEDNYKAHYDGYDPNSAEGHIILSMFQNAFLEQSIRFAQLVEQQIHTQAGRKSRGVKQAGFLVLRETTMPSVLIETGYLTNSNDNAFLLTDQGQRQIAFSIYKAFRTYRKEVEQMMDKQDFGSNEAIADADMAPALPAPNTPSATISSYKSDLKPKDRLVSKGIPEGYIVKKAPPKREVASAVVQYKVQLAVSANLINTNSGYWQGVHHSIEVLQGRQFVQIPGSGI